MSPYGLYTSLKSLGSRKPPAWSLADRTGKDNNNNNPAPNAYNMPAMIGRKVPNKANSPGVPMGLKLKDRMNEDQPGKILGKMFREIQ